jgi:hypothetical protein
MMPAIEAIMTTSAATRIPFAQVVDRNNAAVRPGYLPEYRKSGGLISPKIEEPDRTAGVIAAQLHRQGVACTAPRNAVRDANNSVADEIVWTLRCDEASYNVRLIPHIGARITPIR